MVLLEATGWIGSGFVVASLLQRRMGRLRILNLIGCLLAIGYNWVLNVWPSVALNFALAAINVYFLLSPAGSRTQDGPTQEPDETQ